MSGTNLRKRRPDHMIRAAHRGKRLIGLLVIGSILGASEYLIIMVEILSHFQVCFQHRNRLIDVDPYIGIVRKFAFRPAK